MQLNSIKIILRESNKFINHIDLLAKQISPPGEEIITFLKERKEKYFSQYNYFLGEYSLYSDEDQVKLKLEARLNFKQSDANE